MSYQALARKWRPKSFTDLVGQEHVVRALSHALADRRLHHAYLLTGTRGVGKTTIARIFAKSLNCAVGVGPAPCGVCGACTEIDGGRFVDLLELDAASNTGVDNMREILDNARYAPTAGRYKVYLIDEVHMLSKPAFNSMLKTLEEPPEHVKFVLATTDPQKIPVTVLSRCLQFNLKPLPASRIAARLAIILEAEAVPHERAALGLLAKAAAGSLRDALSLLDQAIAHGGGSIAEGPVREMLGAVDGEYLWRLVEALAGGDGRALLAEVAAMAERGLSFDSALQALAALLHRLAVVQAVPAVLDDADSDPDAGRLAALATRLAPESVQLCYQIALQGRADLPLAPDEQCGFEMTLLRMLAFEPAVDAPAMPAGEVRAAGAVRAAGEVRAAEVRAAGEVRAAEVRADGETPGGGGREALATAGAQPIADWPALVARLPLTGMAQQLAVQSELVAQQGTELTIKVAETSRHLCERAYLERLRAALGEALGAPVRLRVETAAEVSATLAEQARRERADSQRAAEEAFRADPTVRDLLAQFDARIRADSIKPLSN